MKRDLSGENFNACTQSLSEQIGYIGTMTQQIFTEKTNEHSCEFPNGFMQTKYSEISSLLTGKKNSNIEEIISLGKKNVTMSNIDSQSASAIKVYLSDAETLLEQINSMVVNMSASIVQVNASGVNANVILNNLPKERANEIRNGDFFVSADGKYVYLNGYAYEVCNPAIEMYNLQTSGTSITYTLDWKDVYTQSYYTSDFNVSEFLSGTVVNIGNNCDDGAPLAFNVPMLGYSFFQAAADAKTNVRIDVKFQESEFGDRRVIMGVYNSAYADVNNYIYNKGGVYSAYDEAGTFAADYSAFAREKYEEITGNEANEWSIYDLQITLADAHSNAPYQSFLSFDENGNMQETVPIFPGDKKEIVERKGIFREVKFGETVYEFDLEPTPQNVPDFYEKAIMDVLYEGFIGGD